MSVKDQLINSYQLSIHSRFDSGNPQLQCSHVHHLDIVCNENQTGFKSKLHLNISSGFFKIITEVGLTTC